MFRHNKVPCNGQDAKVCQVCWVENHSLRLASAFENYPTVSSALRSVGRFGLAIANSERKFLARKDYIRSHILKINRLIAPSRYMRSMFVASGVMPSQIVYLENGYDEEFFEGQIEKVDNNKLVFAFIGRIAYVKGVKTLIEAFVGMPEGKAELRIYGSYDESDEYARELFDVANSRSDIKILGFVKDVRSVFAEIDVLVFPSLWFENCPLSLAEANIMHTPIIASDIGAIPEFVQDQVNGLLFRAGDSKDLTDKMVRFIDEPGLHRQLALNQIALPEKMRRHAIEVERIYGNVMDE
jgi:glycosyltransferase involved in cell wall biosynthesis